MIKAGLWLRINKSGFMLEKPWMVTLQNKRALIIDELSKGAQILRRRIA